MSGAILPLHNTPPWRGAQLKHRDSFTFYLYRSGSWLEKEAFVVLPLHLHGGPEEKDERP